MRRVLRQCRRVRGHVPVLGYYGGNQRACDLAEQVLCQTRVWGVKVGSFPRTAAVVCTLVQTRPEDTASDQVRAWARGNVCVILARRMRVSYVSFLHVQSLCLPSCVGVNASIFC